MIKVSLLASIDRIFLHAIGDKVAMTYVHEISEMPDGVVPKVHQFRSLQPMSVLHYMAVPGVRVCILATDLSMAQPPPSPDGWVD